MQPAAVAEKYLSVREVARSLSISIRTVWRWEAGGRLPRAIRFNAKCVRWRAAEVQRFLDDFRQAAQSGRGKRSRLRIAGVVTCP